VTSAQRERRNARRRERYADEPEYRETQKANSRVQIVKRDPEAETVRKRAYKSPESRRRENSALRREVIEGYGGSCACCKTAYLPHLTLDHVNGGGTAERVAMGSGGRPIYRRLRRLLREGVRLPEFQILCWNCNAAKHHLGRCGCQG
jgi:5-methylcytosine-specific restriction endonuclease McrA